MPDVAIVEHERVRGQSPSAEELERLWAAPPAEPRSPTAARAAPPIHALRWAWGLYLALILFAPAPTDAAVVVPWWSWALAGLMLAGVTAALALTLVSNGAALGASFVGGAAAFALAVGCMATAHHAPAFWVTELAASGAVLGLSALCLARSRSRA